MKKRELEQFMWGVTDGLATDSPVNGLEYQGERYVDGYQVGQQARKSILITAAREQQTARGEAVSFQRESSGGYSLHVPHDPAPGEQQTREQEPARSDEGVEPKPCDRCGKPIEVCWYAPNELWNRINGSPDGFLCPGCFDRLCPQPNIWTLDAPAQEPVEDWREAKDDALKWYRDFPAHAMLRVEEAERERDEAIERAERAERERDRYDDEAERLGVLSEEHRIRAEAAEHERDELRAAIADHKRKFERNHPDEHSFEYDRALWAVLSKEEG